MALLDIKNLKIDFALEEKLLTAVETVDLSIEEGEILGLIGESGCGKSLTALSVLNLIPTAARIDSKSKVLFKKQNLLDLGNKELEQIRGKEIAMVFQEPMTSLNPVMTVGKQIEEIFLAHKLANKMEAKQKTIEILKKVNLSEPEKIYYCYPHELSGGMRQRIVIGMAIACNPSLLIADEPTTALDVTIQAQIMELFLELKSPERSILYISHNLLLVKSFCHRIAIMYLGEIVEEASVKDLFKNPMHPYTKGLLNAIPEIGKAGKLQEIKGTVPSLGNMPKDYCRFYDRCPEKMERCKQFHPELKEKGKGHRVRCWLYED